MIVGTAGWAIPRDVAATFPTTGSSLQRYAGRFAGVEVNSSFDRSHRPSTWQRWHDSVPAHFRFAVKLPKTISHERRLVGCADLLDRFLAEAGTLGQKFAVLLVQLPPGFAFDAGVAGDFFLALATRSPVQMVCEPRHATWFDREADTLLRQRRVGRVAADPALNAAAAEPGGWPGISYYRLHGSPTMYRSAYDDARLLPLSASLQTSAAAGREAWCMFDNTASGAATADALRLQDLLAN